ncbi:DUF6192 family protein [Streptomyces sp. NPDC002845]
MPHSGPPNTGRRGVSYEVHRILASAPDRFELIRNPPLSERTGRRRWSAEVAKRVVGWKTDDALVPVTAQEKVEAIRELACDDEAVAAQVATDFLRRPEVAFKAMRDPEARDNVHEAQFEQAGLDDDEFDEGPSRGADAHLGSHFSGELPRILVEQRELAEAASPFRENEALAGGLARAGTTSVALLVPARHEKHPHAADQHQGGGEGQGGARPEGPPPRLARPWAHIRARIRAGVQRPLFFVEFTHTTPPREVRPPL